MLLRGFGHFHPPLSDACPCSGSTRFLQDISHQSTQMASSPQNSWGRSCWIWKPKNEPTLVVVSYTVYMNMCIYTVHNIYIYIEISKPFSFCLYWWRWKMTSLKKQLILGDIPFFTFMAETLVGMLLGHAHVSTESVLLVIQARVSLRSLLPQSAKDRKGGFCLFSLV